MAVLTTTGKGESTGAAGALSRESLLLAEIAAAADKGNDPGGASLLAEAAYHAFREYAGTSGLVLYRVTGDELRALATPGRLPDSLRARIQRGFRRPDGLAWRAVIEGRPIYVPRYSTFPGADPGTSSVFDGAGAFLPLRGPGGTPWGALVLLSDSSPDAFAPALKVALEASTLIIATALARDEAAQSLRASEARHRAIVEALPDLLFRISRDGRYLDFQCSPTHPLRVPRETLVGKTLHDVLPERLANDWLRFVAEALDHGRDVIDEYQLNGMDFEGRIAVSGEDEVLAIVRDISERKRRERALAESEERLRLSLEAGRMGIWEWNLETGEVWWSDNLEELHGLPRGGFGGSIDAFLNLVHPDDKQRFQAAVEQAIGEGGDYSIDFRIVPPDGEIRWMRGQGRAYRAPNGSVSRMIGVGSEVTGLKRVEEELRALNSSLEARVAERTRELESRNAELEAFVYTASHDLKAPLLAIQGMAELLGDAVGRGDNGEAAFCLERVERNVTKMGRLLDDLLALSRIGRANNEASLLDLAAVLAQVTADLEDKARTRGVSIEGPLNGLEVLYPPSEAYQLLLNLVGNAVKFAGRPEGGGRVRVSWQRDGESVQVRVDDNGPGVAPEHRAKVFGLFRKLDPQAEGTGVGLAIVERIAKRHGGAAWVEDSPLGGARFCVTLPSPPAAE